MLADGKLPLLAALAPGGSSSSIPRRMSSPGSGEPRERLQRLQLGSPAALHMAATTARKLPDWDTAR